MVEIQLATSDLVVIGLYLLLVVGIGLYFSHGKRTSEDYLLGGRSVPFWAVGISCMMSVVSTVSLVAVPGEIYNNGMSMLMLSLLYPITSILAFLLFIRFYFRLRSFTPFDYLQRRFGTSVRLAISSLYLFTRIIYVAMVLYTSAAIFQAAAGWPIPTTVAVITVIGIFYTMIGGIRAEIWTDVIQCFVMYGGIIVAMWFCVQACDGGLFEVISYAFEHGRGPERYTDPDFYSLNPYARLGFWLLLTFALIEPLFYNSADQITVQRLLSTSSYEQAKKATITNSFMILPITFIPWLIGLAIFTYYQQHPDPRVTSGDGAFFTFVSTMMPSPLPGLILACMLAAAMSTLDSAMNGLSTVLVKDFYLRGIRPDASESNQVLVARILTVVIGVIGAAMAVTISMTSSSLRESVIEIGAIWGSFAIVLGPVYLLGVTSRRVTAGVIWTGVTTCWGTTVGMILWYTFSKSGLTGPISTTWWLAPLGAGAALIAGSRLLPSGSAGRAIVLRLGILCLGVSVGTGFWYTMALYTGGGVVSFLWMSFPGLVLMLLIGFGSIPFLRDPADAELAGLTLWSVSRTPPVTEGIRPSRRPVATAAEATA